MKWKNLCVPLSLNPYYARNGARWRERTKRTLFESVGGRGEGGLPSRSYLQFYWSMSNLMVSSGAFLHLYMRVLTNQTNIKHNYYTELICISEFWDWYNCTQLWLKKKTEAKANSAHRQHGNISPKPTHSFAFSIANRRRFSKAFRATSCDGNVRGLHFALNRKWHTIPLN